MCVSCMLSKWVNKKCTGVKIKIKKKTKIKEMNSKTSVFSAHLSLVLYQ